MAKVTYETGGKVGVITIDSPPVNALDKEVLEELSNILDGIEEAIGAVIVKGAGNKAFVAGADIKEFTQMDGEAGEALSRKGQDVFQKLSELRQPTIAVIDGHALGGGLELALACDFRVASQGASLGLPETTLGVIPGYGGTQRLARLVGPGKAKQMIFSAEPLNAEEAYRVGLVEVYVESGAMETAGEWANKIVKRGPVAVQAAKQAINNGLETTLEEGLKIEAAQFGKVFHSEDKNEGVAAFFGKRKPDFKGK
ncbi:MAG TPA: enoyl-CoA hydratase-related protein [Bacillales bacterium]|nr:enoyl-CoA hydratase-related protein [Bacillales bacterium]